MAGKDYYKILGVDKAASADDVKKAFRKLAHEHHPDKGGNEAKFKEANEAYQVLGDAEKRKQYDQFGAAAFDGSGGGNPFAGGGNPFGGGGGFNFDFGGAGFEDLGDILGGMFGGQSRGASREARGENIEVGVRLSFKEAVFGVEKEIPITRNSVCARCAGTAAEPGTKMQTCKTCEGKGFRIVTQRTMLGAMQMRQACDDCHGTGEKPEKPCTECKGNGVTHGRVTVRVDIPAGVDDGVTVRVRGEGENIGARGEPGDLYLRIRVDADPRFARDGFTIYVEKKIGFTQAALGDTVDVDTVDGKVEVKIPQGTQSGDELRLRGKGVGSARGRGDQIIRITVVTPTKLDKKTQEMLKELNLKM